MYNVCVGEMLDKMKIDMNYAYFKGNNLRCR